MREFYIWRNHVMDSIPTTFLLDKIVFLINDSMGDNIEAEINKRLPLTMKTEKLFIEVQTKITLPFARPCIDSSVQFFETERNSTTMHIDVGKTRLGRFAFKRILPHLGRYDAQILIGSNFERDFVTLLWKDNTLVSCGP